MGKTAAKGEEKVSYIIKNCPVHACIDGCAYCEYDNECLLKQIAEKCKHMQSEFTPDLKSDKYPDKYRFFKSGRADAGEEILSLLEIEEK